MTAEVAVPPERPARRTHPDSGDGGSGDGGGKNGVGGGAASPVGITTYDADGDRRRHSLSSWDGNGCGRDDDDSGQKGGRGDGEATARRVQGNDEAKRIRRQSAMAPQVAGATRQSTSG
jgi:hypothetical protein